MANAKKWVPKNVREVVLQGFDLHAGFFTAADRFTGPHTIVRRGEIQPDVAHGEARFVVPYVAKIAFGKPRRVGA